MSEVEYSRDYAHQCAAWTAGRLGSYRKQCSLEVKHDIDGWIYLCRRHYEVISGVFEERVEEQSGRQVEYLRERVNNMQARINAAGLDDDRPVHDPEAYEARRKAQTVYFIRCEQYVKIGISYNPAGRLQQIKSSGGSLIPKRMDFTQAAIIATEPGGFDREQELHAKFAHLRDRGEWFIEAPELTEYIESLSKELAA